jgi:Zn-dependent M28 family amino/carboxypeptidase
MAQLASGEITLAPPIDRRLLLDDLKVLSFPRFEESDRQRARDYITQTLKAAGWTPQLQSFEGGTNILAEKAGTDPQAGTILLGGHYDTVAAAPGADDNATAVATLLETARLLAPLETPRSLQLAFFDLEELGLVGSHLFVEKLPQPERLKGAVILDMIGYTCKTAGCQSYPPLPIQPPTDRGDFIAAIGDQGHPNLVESVVQVSKRAGEPSPPQVLALSVPVVAGLAPDLVRSDHTPFWQKGIGAVLLTDTANFRNPNYHQPTDTPETIDRDFFFGSAQIVVNTVTALLQQPAP